MSKTNKGKTGRPKVAVRVVTTSIGIHPTALERLAVLARDKHMSRSAMIVQLLREGFPSAFAGL